MSIKHRLTLVTLAAIMLSLATTAGGLFTIEYFQFRDRLRSDVEKSAEAIANNSSAALLFNDTETASEHLAMLQSDDSMVHGKIVLADGSEFASYGDMPAQFTSGTFNSSQAATIDGGFASITRPIVIEADSEIVGYITVIANTSEWTARVEQLLFVIPTLALISLSLAWMASRKWQRRISEPLQSLTTEVQTIQKEKDYNRTVDIVADGELGDLIKGFNSMLETVQQGQQELQESNTMLDQRVQERTFELQEEVVVRTNAENEVRRSQKIVDDFLDNAPLGIAWVSEDGKIMRSNQVLEEVFECSFKDFEGMLFETFFESQEIVKDIFMRLKNDETISVLEAKVISPNGSLKWVQISANVLWDKGLFVFARVFLLDITDVKATEKIAESRNKLERANTAKNDFLSRMSHELRTPMNAILGFGQLLEYSDLKERDRESVDNILRAGRHLLSLIEEVLNISKIESGKLSLSLEPIPLTLVVEEVCGLLNPMATEFDVTIVRDYDVDEELTVLADRQRLVQVLVNLIGNSIKYNKPKGVVKIWTDTDDMNRMRVFIQDTGIGMQSEKLDRLFIPFERLGAESSGIEGSGLGLSLSKSLMLAMEGDIELVSSQPGKGTTFAVLLPTSTGLQMPATVDVNVKMQNQTSDVSTDVSVLCIEDNELNIELMEKLIDMQSGFKLTVCKNGTDGLVEAKSGKYDVVLLDLHLPDISGKEVLTKIRRHEDTKHTPVVIISADVSEDTHLQVMALGADAFCVKPVDLQELVSTLNSCIENKVDVTAA